MEIGLASGYLLKFLPILISLELKTTLISHHSNRLVNSNQKAKPVLKIQAAIVYSRFE